MNKAELIEKILETNPQMTKKALSKCKKKDLDEMYKTLQNHEQKVKNEMDKMENDIKPRKTKIIEFSSFSDSEEEDNEEVEEKNNNVSMSVIKVKKNENIIEDNEENEELEKEFEELPKNPPKLERQDAMTRSVLFDRIDELQKEYNEYNEEKEELEVLPQLQREEPKPKLNILKVKQDLRKEMKFFMEDMKNILDDFKQTKDKDFLADNYNILLRDQEERFFHFLEDLQAPETLFKYADNLLQPHTNRINRLVR